MEQFEERCAFMEFLAACHGAENWEHPFLKERRREINREERKQRKQIPLHIQMAMAGVPVKTK